jgi:hypothetical protein
LHGVPLSGAAVLTPLVHTHAIVSSAWMLVFLTQTSLISAGRPDLHRLLGFGALIVAVALIGIGLMTAIEAAHLGRRPPGWTREAFFIFPFGSVFFFGLFGAIGIFNRHRADFHKRLMLIATFSLLIPAGARVSHLLASTGLPPGPIGGMVLTDIFLAGLVIYDIKALGRLHPVTLWAGGLLLLSQPFRVWFAGTQPWQTFAAALIG